jgi:hypothetical protein
MFASGYFAAERTDDHLRIWSAVQNQTRLSGFTLGSHVEFGNSGGSQIWSRACNQKASPMENKRKPLRPANQAFIANGRLFSCPRLHKDVGRWFDQGFAMPSRTLVWKSQRLCAESQLSVSSLVELCLSSSASRTKRISTFRANAMYMAQWMVRQWKMSVKRILKTPS